MYISNSSISSTDFLYHSSFVTSSKYLTGSNLISDDLLGLTVLGDHFHFRVEFKMTQISTSRSSILWKKGKFWSWASSNLLLSFLPTPLMMGQVFRKSFFLLVSTLWEYAYRHIQAFAFLLLHTFTDAYTCTQKHMQHTYILPIYSAMYTHNHHAYGWNTHVWSEDTYVLKLNIWI